jgi:hypothetical protein
MSLEPYLFGSLCPLPLILHALLLLVVLFCFVDSHNGGVNQCNSLKMISCNSSLCIRNYAEYSIPFAMCGLLVAGLPLRN